MILHPTATRCKPQVEIFRELKTCVDVLFHFTVDSRNELWEWKSLRKRFLWQQKNEMFAVLQAIQHYIGSEVSYW